MFFACPFLTLSKKANDIPVWPKTYNFRGFWSIPYWPSLREPIEVFTDLSDPNHPRQANHFYGQTYLELFDGNISYSVQQSQNGTDCIPSGASTPYEYLPDLSEYDEIEPTTVNGRYVRTFHFLPLPTERPDFYYLFYIDNTTGDPVRFFQHGRSILGSHPSDYILDFTTFGPTIEESAFAPDSVCFINPHIVDTSKHSSHIFKFNKDLGLSGDLNDDQPFCDVVPNVDFEGDLPENFSWRDRNILGIPRDQATCGSCWAQGAARAITAQLSLHYGHFTDASSQQIIDCCWAELNNWACSGGKAWLAYQRLYEQGINISSEQDYPYIGVGGRCSFGFPKGNTSGLGRITGCKQFIRKGATADQTITLLKRALYKYGPLAISIRVATEDFGYLGKEVYNNSACMPTPTEGVNHAVILSGWTKNAWEIQNSWSDLWGDQGYGYIAYEHDCGISTMALLPTLEFDQ